MALPTQKQTKSSKRKRALHRALKKVVLAVCPKCKKKVLPHRACSSCGTYAGKEILKIKLKKGAKKEEKKETKKEKKASKK